MKPIRHGTINGYREDNCRCIQCKTAKKYYERERRAKYLQGADVRHGVRSTWDAGCRCEECRAAHLEAARRYQPSPKAQENRRRRDRRRHQRRNGTVTGRCRFCHQDIGLLGEFVAVHGSPRCPGSDYKPLPLAA